VAIRADLVRRSGVGHAEDRRLRHILPAGYLRQLERHLASTMRPGRLRYYQEGVFRFAGTAQRLLGVR
jgi:hypothetical protein